MKFTKFFMFLSLSIAIASCKGKDPVPVVPVPVPEVLKKLDRTIFSDGRYYYYTYDSLGRRIKTDYNTGSSVGTTTYTYNGTTSITETNTSGGSALVITNFLDGNGLDFNSTYTFGNTQYQIVREFNPDKTLARITEKSKALTAANFTTTNDLGYNYDADKNLISIVDKLQNNFKLTEYERDKQGKNTLGTEYAGTTWQGKSSVNPPKKVTSTPLTGNPVVTIYTNTYDSKGYLTSSTTVSGSTTVTQTYSYK
ncbi:MAG: hypothetical protein RL757_3312 [Bacteroidota bacterium]|jgi:hypothetical protein